MKMAAKKATKRAVLYMRVSTDKQDLSIQVQNERLGAYCTAHGLEIVSVFTEPDVSGAKPMMERKQASAMLKLLAAGDIGHVVALKLDRLFRSAVDALQNVESWDEAGISLHLVDMGGQSLNTGSSMGKMMLTMLAGFAEFERNLIAERTSAALQLKRDRGAVFNHAPYGFDALDGKLVRNETEQRVLQTMTQLRHDGFSYSRLANEMNAREIRAKRGGVWHTQSVKDVLTTAARNK